MFISIVLLSALLSGVEAMGTRYLRIDWDSLTKPVETNASCPGMEGILTTIYAGSLVLKPIAQTGRSTERFALLVRTGNEYTLTESNFTTRLCQKSEMCMVVPVKNCQDSGTFVCIVTSRDMGATYNKTSQNIAGVLYVDSNPGPVYAAALPRTVSDVLNISWYVTCISQIGTKFGGDKKRWHWEYKDSGSNTWTEYSNQSDIIAHEDEEDPDVPCNRLLNSTLRRRLTSEDEKRTYRCYNSRDHNGQWVQYQQYLAQYYVDKKVIPAPGPTVTATDTNSRCSYLTSSVSMFMSNYTFRCSSPSADMYPRLIKRSPPCDDPSTGSLIMCEFQVWLCNAAKNASNCSMTCNDFCLTGRRESCGSYKSACTVGCNPGRYGLKCEHACSQGCTGTCDWVTGICIGITECQTGWYTNKCNIKCPPNCVDVCEQESGNCTECKPGWHSSHCQQKCAKNCLSKCDMEYAYCNACKTGFYGQLCTFACPEHCLDTCHIVDGNCTACVPGRYGHTCEQQCPTCLSTCDQKTGACIEEEAGSTLLIIGASGGLGFLVVLFVVCILCYKKKKKKAKQFPDKLVLPKLTAADKLKVRKETDSQMTLSQIRSSQMSLSSTKKQRSPYVISPTSLQLGADGNSRSPGDLFKLNPDASTSESQGLEDSSADPPGLSLSQSHSLERSGYSFEGSKSGHSLEGTKSGHSLEGTKSTHSTENSQGGLSSSNISKSIPE